MSNKKQPSIINDKTGVVDQIVENLLKHGKVKVVHLGILEIKTLSGHRMPDQSGTIVEVKPYKTVRFKTTKRLKEKIKNG